MLVHEQNAQDLTHWMGKLMSSVLLNFLKTQRKCK